MTSRPSGLRPKRVSLCVKHHAFSWPSALSAFFQSSARCAWRLLSILAAAVSVILSLVVFGAKLQRLFLRLSASGVPQYPRRLHDAQPPDLPPVDLMDMGFAVMRPLARHRRPRIRFLFIGSRLCSTLLSGPASRRVLFRPCASL